MKTPRSHSVWDTCRLVVLLQTIADPLPPRRAPSSESRAYNQSGVLSRGEARAALTRVGATFARSAHCHQDDAHDQEENTHQQSCQWDG